MFLPRRASPSRYNENDDEHRGTNVMLEATEGFESIKVISYNVMNILQLLCIVPLENFIFLF